MNPQPTRYQALVQVREAFASQQDMADFFGVTQPTIWRWLNQSKQLPAEYVLRAEEGTGVSRHWLRPDIYPVDLPPADRFIGVDTGFGTVSFDRRAISQGKAAAA